MTAVEIQGRDAPRVSADGTRRRLRVEWPDGLSRDFAYVWLRHGALCPGGMPNDTVNKLDLLPDDPSDLAIVSHEIIDGRLILRWRDGNLATEHRLGDLRIAATYTAQGGRRGVAPALWDAAEGARQPRFDYVELERPEGLLPLFLAVRDYGFARVSGVPVEPGQVALVAERFGTIQVSNYGGLFDVRTDSALPLGANSAAFLGPHTDENYRHAPPGISFFHCLQAAGGGGGESLLVDGFAAARRLAESDAEAFDVLCRTPVEFRRFGPGEEDMRARGRVIVTSPEGELEGIRFTDRTIPPQDLPDGQVEPFYCALKRFWTLVNSAEFQLRYLLRPGDLHVFDNQRILHGRSAFDPAAGPRHLQQCAVGRDEFHSRLRVLAAELGHPAADARMAAGVLG